MEEPGADNVEEAKGEVENTSSHDKTVEGETQLIATVVGLVELSEKVAANDKHESTQPSEAILVGENRPCMVEVGSPKRKFRDCKEDGTGAGKEESRSREEEVTVGSVDLDDEDPACSNSRAESNECKDAKDLENDHPWSSEGLAV